ncbi:S-adenosylmethionine decarboxylase proenzyme 1 [Microtus ochrogaster]|uniref:S-adenosylmethionine decarboxylase proenzyme 1 n=1 Tax=Microtus ochrogaster TaxID=79684 RepID=A0A8J6GFZ7_MICOH|nr:S-adenosylmethionine decarboxylase proenzyme 1 [Microtus ochrogaster]
MKLVLVFALAAIPICCYASSEFCGGVGSGFCGGVGGESCGGLGGEFGGGVGDEFYGEVSGGFFGRVDSEFCGEVGGSGCHAMDDVIAQTINSSVSVAEYQGVVKSYAPLPYDQNALGKLKQCFLDQSEETLANVKVMVRKNFMKPSHQGYPHWNFQEEIEFLNAVFPNGAACCMGRMNSDCWYLYTLVFPESRVISQPDQTLEILMIELDPAVMDQFHMKDGVTAKDVTRESRICDLIPGSVIDATLFNPCGYSMNGMTSDGTYWTIHITPEPEFSYVSFETNLSQTSYDDLIRKVVEVFKPGKFVTTLFVNQSSKCCTVLFSPQKIEGFKRLDCHSADLLKKKKEKKKKKGKMSSY